MDEINKIMKKQCPECGELITLRCFEFVCNKCGLVIDEVFGEEPLLLSPKDIAGDYISSKEQMEELYNIRVRGKRVKEWTFQYKTWLYNLFNKVSAYLRFNKKQHHNIRDNAAYYYRIIIKNEKKGINKISLLAFCIFYAARKELHNDPITIAEVTNAFKHFGHSVDPERVLSYGIRYMQHIKKDITGAMGIYYNKKKVK